MFAVELPILEENYHGCPHSCQGNAAILATPVETTARSRPLFLPCWCCCCTRLDLASDGTVSSGRNSAAMHTGRGSRFPPHIHFCRGIAIGITYSKCA